MRRFTLASTAGHGCRERDATLIPVTAPTLPQSSSRFVRACLRQPVDRTPVWFLRQAGRYMPEYMAVRKHHTLLEICRTPEVASEVTITAAERLGVDAAIIFADLLLPFTPMGLDFEFVAGEGPVVHSPIRTYAQVAALRTDRADELSYVARSIELVAKHFAPPRPPDAGQTAGDQLGIIGFIGAPFTLASYMIEGGSSRNYIEAKRLMYSSAGTGLEPGAPPSATASSSLRVGPDDDSKAWPLLMEKLVEVLTIYARQQVEAGADVIQVFDSWAGNLSIADYTEFCLPATTELIRRVRLMGVPVIYFGVDTASLLPAMQTTGADVLGLDWRTPLDWARKTLGPGTAVQGNLDPIALFAPQHLLKRRVEEVLRQNANRPGHIFNLGHGIVPGTPVENVVQVVNWVKELGTPSFRIKD